MKCNRFRSRYPFIALFFIVSLLMLPSSALASSATINDIREGIHPEYTRIVLDCIGDTPASIGPAKTDFMPVRFADLAVNIGMQQKSRSLRGAVQQIELHEGGAETEVRLIFEAPGRRVKSMMIPSNENSARDYRLVLDIYPEPATDQIIVAAAVPAATASAVPIPAPEPASTAVAVVEPLPAVTTQPDSIAGSNALLAAAEETSATQPPEGEQDRLSGSTTTEPASEPSGLTVSAEASLILRADDIDGSTAKFQEYRDLTQNVAGDLLLEVEKDRDYYLQGKAIGIGQDDQYVGAEVGRYGKYRIDASWDKIIHRYASDSRTLYSGVGTGSMTIDDNIQTAVDGAVPNFVQVANLLDGYMANAAIVDPETERDRRKLGFDLLALDPFSLRIDFDNEKREGIRPFAGAFSSLQMVELFEPIDYDTTQVKVSGEYAQAPYFLNVAYEFSQFENNIDTLRFDNPLRATDHPFFGSSSGTIDLAPDNQYHNISVAGALTHLPWRSQLTANAAWARMTQDDDLVPFTSNTAITTPALPASQVDAKVDTSLYNFRFTTRPLSFMRVKGVFRYYDYNNRTGVIDFPNGYVETDSFLDATPVNNLPSSYTKTKAGGDVGFDVFKRSNLNLGYIYEKTERENREVARQEDKIMKASLDTRALDWLDIRTSYSRTQRDIGEYRYDVYLDSGQDLNQLPQLRKYDQADLTRDLVELLTTVYPTDALALSGSVSYGTDDFDESPYGLIEDNRYAFSFDADYTLGNRLAFNVFYSHEIYENEQRAQQSGAPAIDWQASGEDLVDTIGGGIKLALIPKHLDLDVEYAYSEVDGTLEFTSPAQSFADFTTVDDSKTHMLNSKLTYHNALGFDVAIGYIWEKFDYADFNTDGFATVPTDAGGSYQGALLSGTLPEDYDAHVIYTRITIRYN